MIVERCKSCIKYKNKKCEGALDGGLYLFACWDFEHEDETQIKIYHELLEGVY